MNRENLIKTIKEKQSFLCIGLDSDINKIPKHLLDHEDPIFEFNKQIIDKTHDLCVAYKPNLAFYEANGAAGLQSLEKTLNHIPSNIFKIADAKRGDIGNTSDKYAEAFFEHFNFDAVTVNPYMGMDTITPYLEYNDKWVILLALTSNAGSADFQQHGNPPLYEMVIETAIKKGSIDNLMFVVGATKTKFLEDIRKMIPDHFLLVPGVGSQGGSLSEVCESGLNDSVGLLVNSSRAIIYAGEGQNFHEKARQEAKKVQSVMQTSMSLHHV